MSAFARLGLAPTRDEREIKRAYARELKRCRPDEDPAGFQALNEAYEHCLLLAREPELDFENAPALEPAPAATPPAESAPPAPADDDGFDLATFLAGFDHAAEQYPTRALIRWLERAPELQSLVRRRRVAEALPAHLRQRRPVLYLQQLKGVLAWFGFNPGFDPEDEPRAWVHALYAAARERGLELEVEEPPPPPLPWRQRWRRDWRDLLGYYLALAIFGVFALCGLIVLVLQLKKWWS